MSNPNKSPLTHGFDGELSPLSPPIKESKFDDDGQLVSEEIGYPDGSRIYRHYYENDQLSREQIHQPNGNIVRKDYWPDGLLKAEWDGHEKWGITQRAHYDDLGQLMSGRTFLPKMTLTEIVEASRRSRHRPRERRLPERYWPNGQLKYKDIENPDGSKTRRYYDSDGLPVAAVI